MAGDHGSMTLLAPEGSGRYYVDPKPGNGPNRANGFTSSYDWIPAGTGREVLVRSPISLEIASQDGGMSLSFTPGTNLVLLRQGELQTWFHVSPNDDPEVPFYAGIFDFIRYWYNESEFAGLQETWKRRPGKWFFRRQTSFLYKTEDSWRWRRRHGP